MTGALWVVAAGTAWGADERGVGPADPLVSAIATEMERAARELRLPDAPGPYHIAALVYDTRQLSVQANLGGLVARTEAPNRTLGAVVRTGSPALDNTNFQLFRGGSGSRGLVLTDRDLALRHDAWLLLDGLYKSAVEALAAKEAASNRRADPDDVADFAPGDPVHATAASEPPYDAAALEALARRLSEVMLAHPIVEWSRVFLDVEAGRRVMLDTGGTEVVEPVAELALRVVGRVRASDGATQVDEVLHVVRRASDLPSEETLVAEVDALAKRLEAWRDLPLFDEEYVGPLLLTDQAAVDAVRHLVSDAIVGTPPPQTPSAGSRVISFDEPGRGPMEPRRRLLPLGWDMDDDPNRAGGVRASAYGYDSEGQPAARVSLVDDGIVCGHVMSRIPSEAFPASNGHGRAMPGDVPRALVADLAITPDKVASEHKQHKAALKVAAAYGEDHYLSVDRLRDPSIDWMDGGPLLGLRDFDDHPKLPDPITIVAHYKDGHTVTYRGASLSGVDLRAFKELVSGGEATTATVESGDGSVFSGPNTGFPVTYTVPDLLFGEAVATAQPTDAERPPRLPNPLADAPR